MLSITFCYIFKIFIDKKADNLQIEAYRSEGVKLKGELDADACKAWIDGQMKPKIHLHY